MKSVDRSLLPAVKRQQIDITFLDGKFDLQKEPIYDNRIITVMFAYSFKTLADMQSKKRQTAAWLSGLDKLVFDDEPDKYYDAKVFEAVPVEQKPHVMTVQVGFECQPYAYRNAQLFIKTIAAQNQAVCLSVDGTAKTCGVIELTNNGTTTVNSFSLRRERLKG